MNASAAAPRLFRSGPDGIARIAAVPSEPSVNAPLGLDAIAYDAAGAVQLTGTAPADGTVRVYLDDERVRDIAVEPAGVWASPLPEAEEGVHTLRLDAVDGAGRVTDRVETPFERVPSTLAVAPVGPGATAVTVQPGSTLWAISQGRYGDGMRYVQIFEANRDLIRNPDLIYPGQVFALPDPAPRLANGDAGD